MTYDAMQKRWISFVSLSNAEFKKAVQETIKSSLPDQHYMLHFVKWVECIVNASKMTPQSVYMNTFLKNCVRALKIEQFNESMEITSSLSPYNKISIR